MIFGALSGLAVLFLSGAMKRGEADELITNGMNMMAFIGFVMLAAAGFANVLEKTGDVKALVEASTGFISNNQVLGALLMLVVGLLITMGIGSSFATIPIIATIFVPLCMQLGFSPMATIAIIGTAAGSRRRRFTCERQHAWTDIRLKCRRTAPPHLGHLCSDIHLL